MDVLEAGGAGSVSDLTHQVFDASDEGDIFRGVARRMGVEQAFSDGREAGIGCVTCGRGRRM
ncbi:MAG: hypothetical protein AAGA87_02980 [Pseudomonadota bacterium]